MKILAPFLFLFVAGLFLTACNAGPEGEKIEAEAAKADMTTKAGATYTVDGPGSQIVWTGSKPTGNHSGTINITDGKLMAENGQLTGGEFDLDMTSITVTDLQPGQGKEDLEGHLKTGDFFEVEKYPNGKFVITNVEATSGKPGVTHTITGNLTMKDQTKSVSIPANVAVSGDVISAVAPNFTIDRTEWGIVYNSQGLASTAKDKIIYDEVGLNLQVKANKAPVQ